MGEEAVSHSGEQRRRYGGEERDGGGGRGEMEESCR